LTLSDLKKDTTLTALYEGSVVILEYIHNFIASPIFCAGILPLTIVYTPKLLVLHVPILLGLLYVWRDTND